jgi:hypothetical protein
MTSYKFFFGLLGGQFFKRNRVIDLYYKFTSKKLSFLSY